MSWIWKFGNIKYIRYPEEIKFGKANGSTLNLTTSFILEKAFVCPRLWHFDWAWSRHYMFGAAIKTLM